MLNVLVIGGGGREHAIVHALAKSKRVKKLWCAPGNPGIAQEAECVAIKADDIRPLVEFAEKNQVDLTVVGPEAPLVLGLADQLQKAGIAVFGPSRAAARLEGSKSFAKEFMTKHGIATARYEVIPNLTKGTYVLTHWPERSVVKADGLAAGKGVKVCASREEAKDFLYQIMENEIFGAAGSTALIEECLDGQEATVMAFCDGETLIPMPTSQDHKRLGDNDQGPNTGGMGAYAPAPLITLELYKQIEEQIFAPFIKGLRLEKFDYRGVIYFGLMITAKGPKVLEFNVRFGDPETQVVLPLLDSDLLDLLEATAQKKLKTVKARWKRASALSVVLAAAGYPGTVQKGEEISGLRDLPKSKDLQVYYAGVEDQKGRLVTSGGRVLNVTGIAPSLGAARDQAYAGIKQIRFGGMQYRKDIGAESLGGHTGMTAAAAEGKLVLDAKGIAQKVQLLIQAIAKEFSDRQKELAIVGIQTRGVVLARRIAAGLKEKWGIDVPVGTLDITLYRDDVNDMAIADQPEVKETELPFELEDRPLVLIDDVLYTGRTVRSAMNALIDYGRPGSMRLAVLVDRGHRELPIGADYVGLVLPTQIGDVVDVNFKELDEDENIRVRRRKKD